MGVLYLSQMDVEQRTCDVSAACGALEVNLTMQFPDSYPNNSVPTFVLNRETSADDGMQSKLIKVSIFCCGVSALTRGSFLNSYEVKGYVK